MNELAATLTSPRAIGVYMLGQTGVILALVVRLWIERKFRKEQRDETTLDDLMKQVMKIAPTVAKIEAQMIVFEPHIFSIPRLQKGMSMLFQERKLAEPPAEENK